MTTVSLENLTKRYGDATVVDRLSLDVPSGELAALLGPSGCGKTTTMRMIAGLLSPDSGDILFDGQSVLKVAAERRGAVMVFQKHRLFPHMSVADNVGFGLKMRGVDRTEVRSRVGKMLDMVQLPGFERRRTNELSGGQQQRIALARALIIEPRVLLLDEPLANLDANLRLEMRQLIRTLQQQLGITTLFVTHDHEEAVMLADRVALMIDGVLQQVDSPRMMFEQPRSATVARFFRNENLLAGVRLGCKVKTSLGEIAISTSPEAPDGPVFLTARPEHIIVSHHLSPAGSDDGNRLDGVVRSAVFMGTYTQLAVEIADSIWAVQAPANAVFTTGEPVHIVLPPEHVWLMPQ